MTRSKSATLSKPAYETLAVIAYRQPVTRAMVASIRGVNADVAIASCSSGSWIRRGREKPELRNPYETTEGTVGEAFRVALEGPAPCALPCPIDTEAADFAEGND